MKRIFGALLLIAGITMAVASCKKEPKQQPIEVAIQLVCEATPFEVEGVTVTLTDATGIGYEAVTDATGVAVFNVLPGQYTATALHKEVIDGERIAYNGQNANILVANGLTDPFQIALNKVVSQQIIIKELYISGCVSNDGAASYGAGQYVILYNNSSDPADASNIVFAHGMPYEAQTTNQYYQEDGSLLYENLDWVPAGSALWWFENPVTIPPYSQIVVVFKQAIDHSQTAAAAPDLSKPEYYWMSNKDIPAYQMGNNYQVSENIPSSHYLTGHSFAMTPMGWALSASSPVFFIGRMDAATAKAMCEDTDGLDKTLGMSAFYALKFPKSAFIDGIEVWPAGNEENCHHRLSADVNSGHISITPKLGYTAYRNVDKAATEALPENEGKLVYGYDGGTGSEADDNLSTDPSGIDAEASIKNGAHIIYSETNNTAIDFHQRRVSSLK